jgi:thioredoxin-dependent peroxiredoxin
MLESATQLSVGHFAPDFTLDADNGEIFTLSALRGKHVVLYFYPKDDTPGCTTEAQDFTRLDRNFADNNTMVIGISRDTIESHCKFRDKYNLTVKLASDIRGTVCEAYDCWVEKNNYGKKYMGIERCTFLINDKGVINKIWRKVNVKGHAEEVLHAVRML